MAVAASMQYCNINIAESKRDLQARMSVNRRVIHQFLISHKVQVLVDASSRGGQLNSGPPRVHADSDTYFNYSPT